MRNAVRASFLAIVLLLFAAPTAYAWCYEAGFLGTVCQGDFQSTGSASIVVNEYGRFGYDFTPEYDGGVHWYEEKIFAFPVDCCSSGFKEWHKHYLDQGIGGWKEFVERLVHDGNVFLLRNAFAYVDIYSTKEKDLKLAEALMSDAEHLDWTAYAYRDDMEAKMAVKHWRVEAEENRKLAYELQSQYLGTPGGL